MIKFLKPDHAFTRSKNLLLRQFLGKIRKNRKIRAECRFFLFFAFINDQKNFFLSKKNEKYHKK